MKTRILILLAIAAILLPVKAANNPDPYADETKAERDARLKWFREARFGLFIHWGVYAVPAGTYQGRQIGGIGEWIMHSAKIPKAEYQSYARDFNPTNYDADAWVRLAKDAGMKYIIITAKHHDGFALFDTAASDWNVVKATPYGKDLLAPLAAACRRHNMKLGFYYSQAQDWNNGGSAMRGKWDASQETDMDEYIERVAVPQTRELLTRYGKFPTVFWWDTPHDMNEERAAKLIELLRLKPGIIHNNRLGGGFRGDTETPEQYVPATGYKDRDWETCMTMNDTWGYKAYDDHWKPTEVLVRNLVDIASKGGNYLLNVGPTADGRIPQPSIDRLREVGDWMKVNGKAVYGTTASPFKRLPWGRCTVRAQGKDARLYLHVFDWPQNGTLIIPGLQNKVRSARLLGGKKLPISLTPEGVALTVPVSAPNSISSTIEVLIEGHPQVLAPAVAQLGASPVALLAQDADLHGGMQVEHKGGKPNIGFWTDQDGSVSWEVEVTKAGRFEVEVEFASQGQSAFMVSAGSDPLTAGLPSTGSYDTFQKAKLGIINLSAPGKKTIKLMPQRGHWSPINLRQLNLKPAP